MFVSGSEEEFEEEECCEDDHSDGDVAVFSAEEVDYDVGDVSEYDSVGYAVGEWHHDDADECGD